VDSPLLLIATGTGTPPPKQNKKGFFFLSGGGRERESYINWFTNWMKRENKIKELVCKEVLVCGWKIRELDELFIRKWR
jgi:hypothetical protein